VIMSVGIDDLETAWHATSITGNGSDDDITTDATDTSEELDTTKVVVLTTIIVLTVLGNVAVILAIICRKMKMNRSDFF